MNQQMVLILVMFANRIVVAQVRRLEPEVKRKAKAAYREV